MTSNGPLPHADTTRQPSKCRSTPERRPALTLLYHPELERVGEMAILDLATPAMVSRTTTRFAHPGAPSGQARSLDDPYVSRQPLVIQAPGGTMTWLQLLPPAHTRVEINGVELSGERTVDAAALERGVVITLAGRVVLVLHSALNENLAIDSSDIVGQSSKLRQALDSVRNIAHRRVPVLVCGEAGTGRALVAAEIARRGRPGKPFRTVSCSTIRPTSAQARLCGVVANGAPGVAATPGLFGEADGGSLFMGELERLPAEAWDVVDQVLQDDTMLPVGASEAQKVDVRVIAATEADMECGREDVAARACPWKRWAGFHQIRLPTLRERREDIGLLLIHFLRLELAQTPGWKELLPESVLRKTYDWLPACLVGRIASYDFPGNVQELRDLVNALVVADARQNQVRLSDVWERRLEVAQEASRVRHATAEATAPAGRAQELVHGVTLNQQSRTSTGLPRSAVQATDALAGSDGGVASQRTNQTILFLAANPPVTSRLELDEEAREIEAKIRGSGSQGSLTLRTRWAVRPDDLLQALNEDRPVIVHFSGHGSGAPGIALHDEGGSVRTVPAPALRRLFETLKDDIRVVVLNACFSVEQARAIVGVVDCVIGMNRSIDDRAARRFAASFYRAIGFGRSIDNAFKQGLAAIELDGLADTHVPVLLTREGVDASGVVLVGDVS